MTIYSQMILRLIPGLALALIGVACSRPQPEAPVSAAPRLEVVASFLPIYAHTARVAGDAANVSMLLSADTGPHDYQLNPNDIKRLSRANLFIINGAGMEDWLDKVIQAVGSSQLRVVDTSAGLTLQEDPEAISIAGTASEHGHHHHDHDHDHSHSAEGENPHIWLDPVIAIHQVRVIEAALIQAAPDHAETFRRNAAAYIAELETLDREFRTAFEAIPEKNLITFHNAFPYFARRYGLNYIGYVEDFPEKDPSPAQLKSLINAIRKNRVRVLFAETGYSPKIFQALAEQTGVRVAELDTLEVGQADPDAYLVRMRANLAALQKAWQP
jgi:ABC-type Zn uptake system ZnuABC Zn-binding protein ZnuA